MDNKIQDDNMEGFTAFIEMLYPTVTKDEYKFFNNSNGVVLKYRNKYYKGEKGYTDFMLDGTEHINKLQLSINVMAYNETLNLQTKDILDSEVTSFNNILNMFDNYLDNYAVMKGFENGHKRLQK